MPEMIKETFLDLDQIAGFLELTSQFRPRHRTISFRS